MVRVSVSSRDGRQRDYELTAKGTRTMQRLRALREQAIADVWAGLPLNDLRAFTRICDLLIDRLRDYAEPHEGQRGDSDAR